MLIRNIRDTEGRYVVESNRSKADVVSRVAARHADATAAPMDDIEIESVEENNCVWTVEVGRRGAA